MSQYWCAKYSTDFREALNRYMRREAPPNNQSPNQLRLADYNGVDGDLFLVLDEQGEIRATAGVTVERQGDLRFAKIYGRFHIEAGIPHSIIDRHFEPGLFAWCLERSIDRLYFTVNEGRIHTWEWVCRRIGEHRSLRRPNPYSEIGLHFRSGLRPHQTMILEKNVWQYAIFYDPQGVFRLSRPQKPLDALALAVMRSQFPELTAQWEELELRS